MPVDVSAPVATTPVTASKFRPRANAEQFLALCDRAKVNPSTKFEVREIYTHTTPPHAPRVSHFKRRPAQSLAKDKGAFRFRASTPHQSRALASMVDTHDSRSRHPLILS